MGKLTKREVDMRVMIDLFDREYMSAKGFKPDTRITYMRDLNGFLGFILTTDLKSWENLKLRHLHGYMAELDYRNYAANTKKKKAVVTQTFVKFLLMMKVLKRDPTVYFEIPKKEEKETRYLSDHEGPAVFFSGFVTLRG